MSNTTTAIPTRLAEPIAPDYAVPDAQKAWERMDRLVGKVLDLPKSTSNSPVASDDCQKALLAHESANNAGY